MSAPISNFSFIDQLISQSLNFFLIISILFLHSSIEEKVSVYTIGISLSS